MSDEVTVTLVVDETPATDVVEAVEEKVETPQEEAKEEVKTEVAPVVEEKVEARVEAKPEAKKPAKSTAKVPAKFEKLVKELDGLSVLDLSELVKVLEDHFGVSAAAP